MIPIFGCHLNDKTINKLWFYTYSSDVSKADTNLTPTTFIDLQNDGTYTTNLGTFNYGKWKFEEHWLRLTDHNRQC